MPILKSRMMLHILKNLKMFLSFEDNEFLPDEVSVALGFTRPLAVDQDETRS